MKVELNLFASLRKYRPPGNDKEIIDISQNINIAQLLKDKEIPLEEAIVLLVNGVRVDYNHVLQEGDKISAFPLIMGG